jgi:hypothetical protein
VEKCWPGKTSKRKPGKRYEAISDAMISWQGFLSVINRAAGIGLKA